MNWGSYSPCNASCPGRGAAFFTLLRRAGTHLATRCGPRIRGAPLAHCAASGARCEHLESHAQLRQLKGRNPMIVSDIRDAPTEQWRPGVETRMLASSISGATQLCIFEQWVA